MSGKYKFHNPDGIYFVSFAVVGWADVFIRNIYKDILLDSFRHCQKKGISYLCLGFNEQPCAFDYFTLWNYSFGR